MKEATQEKEVERARPASVWVADLDPKGVFIGMVEKHREDVTASDVQVAPDAGLQAGKFIWLKTEGRFVPRACMVAKLDADRVFQGMEEKNRDELDVRDVSVPAECDLEPGMYRWDWNQNCFVPILEKFRARNAEAKRLKAEARTRAANPRGRIARP